jgi:four helix bundle protein
METPLGRRAPIEMTRPNGAKAARIPADTTVTVAAEPSPRPRKGDDIARRFLQFATGVIRVVRALPRDAVGKHVGGQLLRAGTSAAANYHEAHGGAESAADFVHKVLVAAKEAREAQFWLEITLSAELCRSSDLPWLVQESGELFAILRASANTARARSKG